MGSHIVGIIGEQDAPVEIVIAGLADLRDQADAEGEAFWAIVGVTKQAPDSVVACLDWLIEEGVTFDIVVESSVAATLPEKYATAADRVSKIKDVPKKVVDLLIENEAVTLLALLGNDGDSAKEYIVAAQRFADIDGNRVLALDDALAPIGFHADDKDETGDGEIDWEETGVEAEGGDAESQSMLTDHGLRMGLDEEGMGGMSWPELAEAIFDAQKAPKEVKAATKKAPAKAKTSSSNKWTDTALDKVSIKDLRVIAAQSEIAGAGKMGLDALKAALLGKPVTGAEEPEAEPTTTKARGAKASPPADDGLFELLLAAVRTLGDVAEYLQR